MGIDFAAFFRAILGMHTPSPPKPLPPIPIPVAAQCTLAIVTMSNGKPVPKASVQLSVSGSAFMSGTTNGDGYLAFTVPTSLVQSYVLVNASGYEAVNQHLDLPGANIEVKVPLVSAKQQPQLRAALGAMPSGAPDRILRWTPSASRDFLRADAWSVPIPTIAFVEGGSSEHPERLLTAFLYKYDKALWQGCFDAHLRRGYTHWILWWPNARADGLSIAAFVEMCQDIQTAGFYTQVGLNSKDFDPRDQTPAQWKTALDPLFDALTAAHAADEYAIWEWDSHNVPGQPTIDALKYMGARAHAAGASFWLHFLPEHTSWFADGDGRGRYGFYDDLGADIDGLQYQSKIVTLDEVVGADQWTVPELQARMVDTLTQFGRQPWGHKLRAFELTAMEQFTHDHPTEDEANLIGYLACCTAGATNVWGFGNGARMPDGTAI